MSRCCGKSRIIKWRKDFCEKHGKLVETFVSDGMKVDVYEIGQKRTWFVSRAQKK